MPLTFTRLHPTFFAEASPVALREVYDLETLDAIRAAMDAHAAIVLDEQAFSYAEQLDFARRLDGALHARIVPPVGAANSEPRKLLRRRCKRCCHCSPGP